MCNPLGKCWTKLTVIWIVLCDIIIIKSLVSWIRIYKMIIKSLLYCWRIEPLMLAVAWMISNMYPFALCSWNLKIMCNAHHILQCSRSRHTTEKNNRKKPHQSRRKINADIWGNPEFTHERFSESGRFVLCVSVTSLR